MTNRRDLLLLAAGLVGVAAGWQVWIRRPQPFDFADIDGLPGWRLLESGQISRPGGDTFLTIAQDSETVEPLSPEALDRVLYRTGDTPEIAVFSDFFCPFCRVLTARLADRPDLPVTWHELPLLGPYSEIAAKALAAADLQGAYTHFFEALGQAAFRPTNAHMGRVGDSVGIDGVQLVRDMESTVVDQRLLETKRAAATLGVYGTPGLTVGRTLVMGEINMADLDRLVALETD